MLLAPRYDSPQVRPWGSGWPADRTTSCTAVAVNGDSAPQPLRIDSSIGTIRCMRHLSPWIASIARARHRLADRAGGGSSPPRVPDRAAIFALAAARDAAVRYAADVRA